MKIKIIIISFILLCMHYYCLDSYGKEYVLLEQACDQANNELGFNYYNYSFFNFKNDIWTEYGVFAKGEVSGDIKFSDESNRNEHRYIGNTIDDDKIPNKYFPDDHTATTVINQWKWIEMPTNYKLGTFNQWSYKESNEPYIRQALKDRFGDLFDETQVKNWYTYVHVLQPRTTVCDGVGRMWHDWDSNGDGIMEQWYITIILPRKLKQDAVAEFDIYHQGNQVTDNYDKPVITASPHASVAVALQNKSQLNHIDEEHCTYEWFADEGQGYVAIATTEHAAYTATKPTTQFKLIIHAGEHEKITREKEHTFYLKPSDEISQSNSSTSGYMSAEATAVIQADPRGNEAFNTLDGIPTGEKVYIQVHAKSYLSNISYVQKSGTKYYTVTVSKKYKLKWKEDKGDYNEEGQWEEKWMNKKDTKTIRKTYTIPRTYAYWEIAQLEIFGLDKAVIQNEALPNHQMVLAPKNYTQPEVDVWHSTKPSDHMIEPNDRTITLKTSTLNGGKRGKPSIPSSNWLNEADAAISEIQVKNDKCIINHTIILDDSLVSTRTTAPSALPKPPELSYDTLYTAQIPIEHTKPNKYKLPSTGSIHYSLIKGIHTAQSNIQQSIKGINPVTIHTPVICKPTLLNQQDYSQTLNHNTNAIQLQIGHTMILNYPTKGQHRGIKGYGLRDYEAYVKKRQVKFPFDIYIGHDRTGVFGKKNTWMTVPDGLDEMIFYIPTWVKEDTYTLLFRTIPLNFTPEHEQKYEYHANLDINKYKAVEKIDVQVTGRLYDFRITDISDWNWQKFFRKEESTEHTGKYFYSGDKDRNGKIDSTRQYHLPIMEDKNDTQGYESYALKLGYRISFDLITNGDYMDKYDCILITPTYYYMSLTGKQRQEVDLYYESCSQLIKIGSQYDKLARTMILNDSYRNISKQEIWNTAKALDAQNRSYENKSLEDYQQMYFSGMERSIAKGGRVLLTEAVRTFIGSTANIPSSITQEEAIQSVQKWYGEFYLPSSTVAVPKGTDLTTMKHLNVNESPFLHNGYIMVNFKLEGIQDADLNNPVQAYNNPSYTNQWLREGFKINQDGFHLTYGDIVLYYTDKRASEDYVIGR